LENEAQRSIHLLNPVIVYGISANEHDASLAVLSEESILFASSSERYSRLKNDPHLNLALINEARSFGDPELIVWYEKPIAKRLRKLWAGQYRHAFRIDGRSYLRRFGLTAPHRYVGHHESHAAAGFFTSPFEEAAILVIDAIGEWETISAWAGQGTSLRKLWSQRYPHSLGLLYSAFTHRLGLKPNDEEYILMGMAAYGRPLYSQNIWQDFIARFDPPNFRLKETVHRGIRSWRPDLLDSENIAASIQHVTESIVVSLAGWLANTTRSKNLVLMGGLALNCVANTKIARAGAFEAIWIMPNPGDAGSSIGAAAAYLRRRLNWVHPFLGHDIQRPFDEDGALKALVAGEVIGVAHGRAEFGPRALGNRSILVDPRASNIKSRINSIKQREAYRPFAPVIRAEYAREYFDLPVLASPYMQFVGVVRQPETFPGITHVDGTARVQTLTRQQNPHLYRLLERFHAGTGCPMLLNTSLNVKGEPLANTWEDAKRFGDRWGIKVF
jgi:carbamoyltransferase